MSDTLKFEQLEERRLLAVSVTTGKQGLLKITGDADGDVVEVDGTGSFGEVDVFVNGGFVGTFSGVKTIKAALKGGDDDLHLSAIQIGGAVDVNMGGGTDLFDIDTEAVGGEGYFTGDVFIGGSVIANLGNNNNDAFDCESDVGGENDLGITIGNNVTVTGSEDVEFFGKGVEFGVEADDISIGGFLKITSKVAGEEGSIELEDVNVGGTTVITFGSTDDFLRIFDSSFARRVEISMGGGDDFADLDNGAGNEDSFAAVVVLNGGNGTDELDENPATLFAVAPVINGFEIFS